MADQPRAPSPYQVARRRAEPWIAAAREEGRRAGRHVALCGAVDLALARSQDLRQQAQEAYVAGCAERQARLNLAADQVGALAGELMGMVKRLAAEGPGRERGGEKDA